MKVSDYIVQFLINNGITDVFGYPGGMVTHLLDSFDKEKGKIRAHINYHEQASSFCACGYAAVCSKPGVAFATSGPGATNLVTGICNAFFDSTPAIFITGQVNVYEGKKSLKVRQKGFQEMDIISLVKDVTKYAVYIEDEKTIRYHLEKAYQVCKDGRPGPVLLDIPMNIQRAEIDVEKLGGYPVETEEDNVNDKWRQILQEILNAKRPCIIAGAGVRKSGMTNEFRSLVKTLGVPVLTSMIGVDVLPTDSIYNFGFIGAYGARSSNFILSKSDLIIALGSRLDGRQIRNPQTDTSPEAKIIRIDVDKDEMSNKVSDNEEQIVVDLRDIIPYLLMACKEQKLIRYNDWISICNEIKGLLCDIDKEYPNIIIREISKYIDDQLVITTDVGQNQVWVAQSFLVKENQQILFSGGHGAMGYSLPAAIGAYYGSKDAVFSFNGDGGIQMNIQELQFIARENLPIKIIVLNNKSLGMIRHFQEMYFNSNYVATKQACGYTTPDFQKIAQAYGLNYVSIKSIEDIELYEKVFKDKDATFIEVSLSDNTYVYPKLAMGKPSNDQDPLIQRDLYSYLLSL